MESGVYLNSLVLLLLHQLLLLQLSFPVFFTGATCD
jgi:hypothetical protein